MSELDLSKRADWLQPREPKPKLDQSQRRPEILQLTLFRSGRKPTPYPNFSSGLPLHLSTMQKVLRRALLARNQTLRAKRAAAKKEAKEEERDFHRTRIMRDKALRGYVKAERTARREDWVLGPLAPQRDVGDQKGVYGTMSAFAMQPLTLPERRQDKYVNFAVGDRAVVVRGRARGKIAYIYTINTEAMKVCLDVINTASAT